MPPIFGIVNTRLQRPDPGAVIRMKDAARYIKPRRVEVHEWTAGFGNGVLLIIRWLKGTIPWCSRAMGHCGGCLPV
jgi:hypothetical protein